MPNSDRPNIILINCDDLGYGDIGCYGSSRNRTPRLDAMAAEGARFTDFYMAAPVCSPSRAAMMTGCYAQRVGLGTGHRQNVLFPGDPVGLNPNEISISSALHGAGYTTMLVGKWHLGDQPPFLPTRHGFDQYFGLPYSNDMEPGNVRLIKSRGLEGMPPLPLLNGETVIETQPDQASLTQRYTRAAQTFIREHREEPFFLYLAHMYVHNPLHPPKSFLTEAGNGPYGAEVECIDWSTGELLDTLDEAGLARNTLVIFTSDNGAWLGNEGSTNAPLRGQKGTTWEGGLRVPCIARWPGRIPAGIEREDVITAMDFLPTFATLAGATLPADHRIDGHDIRSLLFNDPEAASPYEGFFYYHGNTLLAVRWGSWKLHLASGELYDLATDIGETRDLGETRTDVVAELMRLADTCREDLGDASLGICGSGTRPCGRVDRPTTLVPMSGPLTDAAYD
jgi:arylsulfatase A-like enzyme